MTNDSIEIHGGEGDDALNLCSGNGTGCWANMGDGEIEGGNGTDNCRGSNARDKIYGQGDPDYLWGYDGNDEMYGGGHCDDMWGGQGDDEMDGNEGDDDLWGEEGDDILKGGPGEDTLWGGDGVDCLYGGLNNDDLWGEDVGTPGTCNYLHGGLGSDTCNCACIGCTTDIGEAESCTSVLCASDDCGCSHTWR